MKMYDYVCRICPQAEGVIRFIRDGRCRWLFGCGQQAVNCNYIFSLIGLRPDGCMVTKPRQKYFMGLSVLSAESLEIPRDVDVLIAVGGKASEEIKAELEALGYLNIYTCSDWESANATMKQAVFREYCCRNGIDMEKPVMQLGEIRLLNPFRYPQNYSQLVYGTTFSEIIVPGVFGDDRYGNAGLYALFRKRADEGKNVYDIGAGIGVFGAMAAQWGCPTTVFEPARSVLRYLYANAEHSHNMMIEEYAVSDSSGGIDFYDRENYPKYSTIIPTDGYSRYTVQSVRLDEYISGVEAKPDIIRIAVDEIADRILIGAQEYIRKEYPDLMVAVASEEMYAGLIDTVRSLYSDYTVEKYTGWIYVYEK